MSERGGVFMNLHIHRPYILHRFIEPSIFNYYYFFFILKASSAIHYSPRVVLNTSQHRAVASLEEIHDGTTDRIQSSARRRGNVSF